MKKILNFGSLNIDYVYSVAHFVRPGETISSNNLEIFGGGKGLNQSIALARAGAEVYHAGCVGGDGEFLVETLSKSGVETRFINRVGSSSGHAIIQVDEKGQNCILLHSGANYMIDKPFIDSVFESFGEGDYLLIQNEIINLDYIVERAKERGMTVVLNPSPINEKLFQIPLDKIDIFILNEIEALELTGKQESGDILADLSSKFPAAHLVLTLGKAGAIFYDSVTKEKYSHGIYDVPVVDTTAAGDTFTGYFMALFMEEESPEIVMEKASKASSIAVSIMGASISIPTLKDVEESQIKLMR